MEVEVEFVSCGKKGKKEIGKGKRESESERKKENGKEKEKGKRAVEKQSNMSLSHFDEMGEEGKGREGMDIFFNF